MDASSGMVFHIQRHSIHDGPGTRTTVFFKGCNLMCAWCHNPESISMERDLGFHPEKCIGCGRCMLACNSGAQRKDEDGFRFIDRTLCSRCMKCTMDCYAEALVPIGQEMTVEELVGSILTDEPYYAHSGGGVTFSGGECMVQADFLARVLEACKRHGIHTAVDTAGCVPWEDFLKILDNTDLFLYDVKTADGVLHRRMTGADNALILGNLSKLCSARKRIIVRIPFVPGVSDSEMDAIARILAGKRIEKVEIIPYHRLGEGKYDSLGMTGIAPRIPIPSEERIREVVDRMRSFGVPASAG